MLGLRDGRTKFIYELDSGRARMFDLERDPAERLNVAGKNTARARKYENLLRRWAAAQKHLVRSRPASSN